MQSPFKAMLHAGRAGGGLACGDCAGEQHPGNAGVNAGRVHGTPEQQSAKQIWPQGLHPFAVHVQQSADKHGRGAERDPVDVGGVEERDHEDGADVVDDGQRGEKDAESGGHTIAQQGDDAEGERNVGGHRDAPASHGCGIARERDKDERRHRHAADRAYDRQCGLSQRRERSDLHLMLDLETHHEKEEGHQTIVHHMQQRG